MATSSCYTAGPREEQGPLEPLLEQEFAVLLQIIVCFSICELTTVPETFPFALHLLQPFSCLLGIVSFLAILQLDSHLAVNILGML